MADHLIDRGDLETDQCGVIDAMVGLHLKKHGGDVEKSLAALPTNRSAHARLAVLGEPEIDATLARFARSENGHDAATENDDPDRTCSNCRRLVHLRRTAVSHTPAARAGAACAAVFVAFDGELHREVALKQILEKHADDPVSRQRFIAEAEITGALEHPGVVPVYGLGADAEEPALTTRVRFVKGDSLKEAAARFHEGDARTGEPGRRSLALRELLRRFTQISLQRGRLRALPRGNSPRHQAGEYYPG